MRQKVVLLTFGLLSLLGCTPYQNSSSCPMVDKYGKCISVEKAYKEAVTGVSQGMPMVPKSKQKGCFGAQTKEQSELIADEQFQNLAFAGYRARSYQELTQQLNNPKQPLLLHPVTVRTLVLPYTSDTAKSRFYMPRFVYSIVQDAQWLGDQNAAPESVERRGLTDSRRLSK